MAAADVTSKIKKSEIQAYYTIANSYSKKGDFDKAIKNYLKIIKIDPSDVNAYNRIAHI